MDEGVFAQGTNVAMLPGIVRCAYCMPDGHWGYGFPIGLLRLRVLRPLPAAVIVAALEGRRAVAVIDQNLAPGLGGITYQEIAAALYATDHRPPVLSVIGGLGGKDISEAEFDAVFRDLQRVAAGERVGSPRLLYTQPELDRGPKLFMAHAPCPTGWLYDPERTAEYARFAVETGLFALKEAVDGVVTHTYVPRRRRPVEAYLYGQGRYRHLFEPVCNETAIQQIQAQVDRYWAEVSNTAP